MANTGKTPPGSKPFRLNESSKEFDAKFSSALNNDFTFQVTITKDSTIRDAWAELHFAFVEQRDKFELEASQVFAEKLRNECSVAALTESFTEVCTEYLKDTHNTFVVDEALGIEQPVSDMVTIPQELFTEKLNNTYKSVALKIKAADEKRKKDEEAAAKKEEAVTETLDADVPRDLLIDVIDKRIVERVINGEAFNGEAAEGDATLAATAYTEAICQRQGNGLSPEVPPGQNQNQAPTGSGTNDTNKDSNKDKKAKKQKKQKPKGPKKGNANKDTVTDNQTAQKPSPAARPPRNREQTSWSSTGWHSPKKWQKSWTSQKQWWKSSKRGSWQSWK